MELKEIQEYVKKQLSEKRYNHVRSRCRNSKKNRNSS